MTLLSEVARKRIAETIAEIEQRTAAELVVVSVADSDHYADIRFGYALAVALLCAPLVHWGWPHLSVSKLLEVQLASAVLVFGLLAVPALLRVVAPRARMQRSVERRASLAFLEHGVFATRDRSGVLILVSELERRVVMLGDAGIHSRVQMQGWQTHVQQIIAAIREGRAGEGLCEVLRALGATLQAEFPVRPDDTNELSNEVR
jgi:putative membrane protein